MRQRAGGSTRALRGAPASTVAAGLLLLLGVVPGAAQLPPASVASAGLGDHDVATVRGFGAVAANPAALGLGPGDLTATVLPVRFGAGLHPVSLAEVAEWEGEAVPDAVRHRWLDRIGAHGRQRGTASLEATAVAASFRGFGVQLSTTAAGRVELNEDAAELLLFGNAGRTGEPRTFELRGSRLDARVVSTLAVARGQPVARVRDGRLAVGGAVRLVVGNAVVVARDVGTTLVGGPLEGDVRFPVLSNPSDHGSRSHGTGFALDVGAAWEGDGLSLAASVRNAVNTFDWDLGGLVYRPGTALFDQEGVSSDFEERPAVAAPRELRDAVAGMDFGPTLEVGAGLRLRSDVRLVASAGGRPGDDLVGSPTVWMGAGVEARRWERLPVRAHVTALDGAVRLGGGVTLALGPVELGGAGSVALGGSETASSWALGVSWWDR